MNRIAAAILAGAVLIAGSILWTAPRAERIDALRVELSKTELLLEQALRQLHHERLLHFGDAPREDHAQAPREDRRHAKTPLKRTFPDEGVQIPS